MLPWLYHQAKFVKWPSEIKGLDCSGPRFKTYLSWLSLLPLRLKPLLTGC